MERMIFKNFEEYWKYSKYLCPSQREIIFNCLSRQEREALKQSYQDGGWEDLEMRNVLDRVLDDIKAATGIDFLQIKMKLLMGENVKLKKNQWEYIGDTFKQFKPIHTEYILGGVVAEDIGDDAVLLLRKNKKHV